MTRWLTPTEEAAWRAYIEGSLRLNARIDDDLQASQGMTMFEYHVLLLLAEAPDGRLRMRELADRMVFSPSRLTYQVARMVREGVISREPCDDDRRGSYASITPKGRRVLGRAALAHVESVRKHLLRLLDPDDIRDLGRIFTRVRSHLEPPGDSPQAGSRPSGAAAGPRRSRGR
jgi:DNA-binding MarR family transcriptional regulator